MYLRGHGCVDSILCDGDDARPVDRRSAAMSEPRFSDLCARLYPEAILLHSERLTGGVSADVFRLDLELADGSTTSVVCRMHGEHHSGHPAELEYRVLAALHEKGLKVPAPLLVDAGDGLLPDPWLVIAFVDGSSQVPEAQLAARISLMAEELAGIHATNTKGLPDLPERLDPLPELFDFLPEEAEWTALRAHLQTLSGTRYNGPPSLLHGDYWPENLLWRDDAIVAVLDWEDAALGDPLSDVAVARVELRYRYGPPAMQWFTEAYAKFNEVDPLRLALWQVYVAAAAQKYMGLWRLEPAREAHMRREALASIREAGELLMGHAGA